MQMALETFSEFVWVTQAIGPVLAAIPPNGTFWSNLYLTDQPRDEEGNVFSNPVSAILVILTVLLGMKVALEMALQKDSFDGLAYAVSKMADEANPQPSDDAGMSALEMAVNPLPQQSQVTDKAISYSTNDRLRAGVLTRVTPSTDLPSSSSKLMRL